MRRRLLMVWTRSASKRLNSAFATHKTAEAWRSNFNGTLDRLRQSRSWGRSHGEFNRMSAVPSDHVPASWRAAAAHNAGCLALQLGEHKGALAHFERALRLKSGKTPPEAAFAAVTAVSNLGIGVSLMVQNAQTADEMARSAAVSAVKNHLLAAHEAAAARMSVASGGDEIPSSA